MDDETYQVIEALAAKKHIKPAALMRELIEKEVLRLNAELKQLNEQLRREKQLCEKEDEAMVLSVKEEYSRKELELNQTQEAAEQARADAEATRSRQTELVEEKAAQAYNARKTALEGEYKVKTSGYCGFLLGCLLYVLLTTVFTSVKSDRFLDDFTEFFSTLWAAVCWIAGAVLQLGQTAAVVVHWLLLIVVVGGISAALMAALFWGGKKLLGFYKENYADIQSLEVFLISLAVAIFFAEPIRAYIPLNLLLLLLLVYAAYIGVRWYLVNKGDRWI